MDAQNNEFVFAGSLEQLKAKGRLVLHGHHRPILVIYDRGRVFALDNRCPHMGFPLERGSVDDRPLRSWKRVHLRPMGGRRTELPGRDTQ